MSKIAPHEGNELDMLLAGTKVFAVLKVGKHDKLIERMRVSFYSIYFPINYRPVVCPTGNVVEYVLYTEAGLSNKVLYTALVNISEWYIETFGKEDYQRKMGKIFGYSDEDIEEFVKNPPDCNCMKCGG